MLLLLIFPIVISDRVPAHDTIWIVGDDFVSDTIGEFLQSEDIEKPYIRDQYDVKVLCSTSLSPNHSVIARLHNNLVNGLEEQPLMPKAIILVMDSDIIKTVYQNEEQLMIIFNQLLRNLLSGVPRVISTHRERMPIWALRPDFPTVLWTLVPLHKNFLQNWNIYRKKFNKCLEMVVCSQPQMGLLKLLKIWNTDDPSLFTDRRFTAVGLELYWASFDSAFRHWDTFVYTKNKNKMVKINQQQ